MAVAVALWSIEVAPGEPIEVSPQADLRITNVALSDELADANGRTSLKLTYASPGAVDDDDEDEEDEDEELKLITTVLSSLTPGKIEQSTLDLIFSVDEPFLLQAVGKNTLHVTGNYVDQAGADFPPSDDEEEDDFDLQDVSSDVEVDPAELDVPSDDEEDEDAGRFEEITAADPSSTVASKKRGADTMDASMDVDDGDNLSKAQKKKLAKKLKGTDGSAVTVVQSETTTTTVTPAAAESKKDKKTKGKEDPSKAVKDAKSSASSGEKELAGGLKIRDATTGTGKTAKSGNTVSVRYIGKLTNGKIFDKNTKGKPFTFTLGAGEVIKGWDQGIAGMAIGGERVLTVPAALGYGKRGSGKEIPPNSTLIFEVKLLEIK